MFRVADLLRPPRAPPPGAAAGSAASIIRCRSSPAELMNLSPARQSRVRASRSLPVSFPSPVSVALGLTAPPPCGRPCSPGLRIPIRTSRASGSIPRFSSRPLSCLTKSGALSAAAAAVSPSGGSAPLIGGEDSPAFRIPCSVTWCGLLQPPAEQLDCPRRLPTISHPTLVGCRKQSKHSCFMWTRSNLSFGVISRNVGQSFGACFLIHPNTGHCLFFRGGSATEGAWPPAPPPGPAVGNPPPASLAALAAFLAALFFFFLP